MRKSHRSPNPAIDAEVDQRGKGPDVLFINEFSEGAEDRGYTEVHGQCEVFAMQHRRQRQRDSAGECRRWAEQQRQQRRPLKRKIGSQEIRHPNSYEHAQRQRDADPCNEPHRLSPGTVGAAQQQLLEARRSCERTRKCGRHAQLHQQRDEDQVVTCVHDFTLIPLCLIKFHSCTHKKLRKHKLVAAAAPWSRHASASVQCNSRLNPRNSPGGFH